MEFVHAADLNVATANCHENLLDGIELPMKVSLSYESGPGSRLAHGDARR